MGVSELFASFVQRANNKSLTLAWVFTLVVLTVALLGTWNFIPMVISNPILGIMMVFGGAIMVVETIFEQGFDPDDKNDIAGIITATFAILYGSGLIAGITYLQDHFGGVQGGVLLILVLNLLWEGIVNRS